jgi:hypothetical protein
MSDITFPARRAALAACVAALLGVSSPLACAAVFVTKTLGFDDRPNSSGTPLPNGYGSFSEAGVTWDGFSWGDIFTVDDRQRSAYEAATVSENVTAFNAFSAASVQLQSSSGAEFTFESAFFTAPQVAQTITLTGYRDGAVVPELTFSQALTTTPTQVTLHWQAIDALTITRVLPPNASGVTQWAMDNFVFTVPSPVPEPSAWIMLLAGLGAAAFALRRRRTPG